MNEPLVEIVYSLNEEDLLHHVRLTLKSRFKDPMFRYKLAFIGNCILALAGLAYLLFLVFSDETRSNKLMAAGVWLAVGATNAYRTRRVYRRFYEKVRKGAQKTDWLVFRANRTGFTITRPGISENAINWTAIKSVNLAGDYLYINTLEEMTYRVPRRCIKPEQWEQLRLLLQEIWN